MKKTLLTLAVTAALSMLSVGAYAADAATNAAGKTNEASKPGETIENKNTNETKKINDVNPYSGTYVEIERAKTQIELTHLQATLADEATKKATAQYMQSNSDKLAKAALAIKLKEGGGAGGAAGYPRTEIEMANPGGVHGRTAKSKKAARSPKAQPVMAMPSSPAPVVSGPALTAVIDRGTDRVAVIDTGSGVINARVGDAIAGIGVIKEIDARSIKTGSGNVLSMKSQVAMADVDKQAVGAAETGGTGGKPPKSMAPVTLPPPSFPSFGGQPGRPGFPSPFPQPSFPQ